MGSKQTTKSRQKRSQNMKMKRVKPSMIHLYSQDDSFHVSSFYYKKHKYFSRKMDPPYVDGLQTSNKNSTKKVQEHENDTSNSTSHSCNRHAGLWFLYILTLLTKNTKKMYQITSPSTFTSFLFTKIMKNSNLH